MFNILADVEWQKKEYGLDQSAEEKPRRVSVVYYKFSRELSLSAFMADVSSRRCEREKQSCLHGLRRQEQRSKMQGPGSGPST